MVKCNIINGNTTTEHSGLVILELEDTDRSSIDRFSFTIRDTIEIAGCLLQMANTVANERKR